MSEREKLIEVIESGMLNALGQSEHTPECLSRSILAAIEEDHQILSKEEIAQQQECDSIIETARTADSIDSAIAHDRVRALEGQAAELKAHIATLEAEVGRLDRECTVHHEHTLWLSDALRGMLKFTASIMDDPSRLDDVPAAINARSAMKGSLSKFALCFPAIWNEHEDWSYQNFGGPEVKGPIGPIKHLGKEQKELLENPNDASEYADCMFLIMDAARRQGLGLQGLLKAMADKQKILWTRDYKADPNKPDEPVEHNRKEG